MLGLLRRFRFVFLAVPILYVLFLAGVATARSSARRSVISGFRFAEDKVKDSAGSVNNSVSNVHLEQFERVEFRAGTPLWSVKAKDARYYPADAVTHVHEPKLRIYRNREEDVNISGDAARLSTAGTSLNQARIDGHVEGSLGGGVTFETTQGNYNVSNRTFETKELMWVRGQGFEVAGLGFVLHLESGEMEFQHQVQSVFRSGAVAPKSLPGFASMPGAETTPKRKRSLPASDETGNRRATKQDNPTEENPPEKTVKTVQTKVAQVKNKPRGEKTGASKKGKASGKKKKR